MGVVLRGEAELAAVGTAVGLPWDWCGICVRFGEVKGAVEDGVEVVGERQDGVAVRRSCGLCGCVEFV